MVPCVQVKREQAGAGSSWQPSPADNVVFDLTQCDQPASQVGRRLCCGPPSLQKAMLGHDAVPWFPCYKM